MLPFIDEKRLLDAIEKVYPQLSDEEKSRNTVGNDILFISEDNALYNDLILSLYTKKKGSEEFIKLNTKLSNGLSGIVHPDKNWIPNSTLFSPLTYVSFPDIENDKSMSLVYKIPKSSNIHKSMLLRGVKLDKKFLDINDIQLVRLGLSAQKNYSSSHYSGYINVNNTPLKQYTKTSEIDINSSANTISFHNQRDKNEYHNNFNICNYKKYDNNISQFPSPYPNNFNQIDQNKSLWLKEYSEKSENYKSYSG